MSSRFLKLLFSGSRFNRSLLLLAISLLVFVKEAHSTGCVTNNPDENEKALLQKISPLSEKTFTVKTVSKDGKQEYQYNIGICSAPDKNLADSGAVQSDVSNKTKISSLGRLGETTILAGKNWIMLSYYAGEKDCNGNNSRTTSIVIVCDQAVEESELRFISEKLEPGPSRCLYTFEIGSKLVCPPVIEPGLSHGSVFCILFFTGCGIYLILGFLYQRLVIGAQGLEQIPNYAFWREFGSLQADGCDFICRCGSKREANSYRGIEDRLPREDERDDQLLNM